MLIMKFQKKKWKKQFLLQLQQKNKIPGINLRKDVKYLYAKNYKALLQEIEKDAMKWKDTICS